MGDLEPEALGLGWNQESLRGDGLDVDELVAPKTDEVIVLVNLGIEPDGGPWVTDSSDDVERDQQLHDSIDRSSRDVGDSHPNVRVDLVCRGVIIAGENCLEDQPPLMGQGSAPLPARLLETPDALATSMAQHVG